ncbi:MAG: hypothetical protein IIZ52_03615 [Erysipelotrichaceae bacterium]|nr:hypothetical protein [Erysipelotrichaceae bacterium]MBQ1512567.1 hypothetical protein [Erysipelotrichaceae bacterium]
MKTWNKLAMILILLLLAGCTSAVTPEPADDNTVRIGILQMMTHGSLTKRARASWTVLMKLDTSRARI